MSVRAETRRAAQSPWVDRLGRAGLVAKGVSYGLVAVLALGVALGSGDGKTTTRQGALRTLAHHGWGNLALVLLAIGFAGYALWRFVDAFLDRKGDGDDAKGLGKRAGAFARGAVYAGLLYTTIAILNGSGGGGGSGQTKRTTAGVFDWPGGRWLVLAAGVAVAGAAVWNVYRGLSGKFEDKLRVHGGAETAARWLGGVGHCARGIVFGIIAWFLAKAAIQFDAKEAISLDGALAKLAHQPYGKALLGVTAAGLLAYGVYCLFEAKYRDLRA